MNVRYSNSQDFLCPHFSTYRHSDGRVDCEECDRATFKCCDGNVTLGSACCRCGATTGSPEQTEVALMRDDMLKSARRAVDENVRHSNETLYMLLADYYPQASDELLEEIVEAVL